MFLGLSLFIIFGFFFVSRSLFWFWRKELEGIGSGGEEDGKGAKRNVFFSFFVFGVVEEVDYSDWCYILVYRFGGYIWR